MMKRPLDGISIQELNAALSAVVFAETVGIESLDGSKKCSVSFGAYYARCCF